jgi:hypothetical protein
MSVPLVDTCPSWPDDQVRPDDATLQLFPGTAEVACTDIIK